jgi:alpha-N-arabinofuranosidase
MEVIPMKTLKLLLTLVVLFGLMTAPLRSQQPAVIKIDLDRKIAKIDPNIYGAFVEPIRTVVYGSIYDPKSPFADENGFRKDFVQLVRSSTFRW